MIGVLIRRGEFGYKQKREDGYVKMKTEIGVMLPQAEWLGLPEAERGKEGSFLKDIKESMALLTP